MTLNFDIKQSEYDIIKDILAKFLPDDCKIWVFGSRAKFTTRFNSDLDLAIDCNEIISPKILYDLKEELTQSRLPYTVDIVDINKIDIDFKKIILHHAIAFPK